MDTNGDRVRRKLSQILQTGPSNIARAKQKDFLFSRAFVNCHFVSVSGYLSKLIINGISFF
jgi:hypothetical protein